MQRKKNAMFGGDRSVSVARLLMAAALSCLSLYRPAHAQTGPKRVVSANLCADQILLELADPDQIVSLSPFAADPTMSFLAARARDYPANRGTGEALVMLQADLVLVGPYDSRYTRDLLGARHMRFLTLSPWSSLAEGFAQIRTLAETLGHSGRGEGLIKRIEDALGKIANLAKSDGPAPTSLVLHRRGFVFHAGVTGEILERAGLRDAAQRLGVNGSGFVQMERLLTDRPDFLIVADNQERPEDQGEALLVHPALLKFFPLERRLVIPDELTLCGGPSTPALIDRIGQEIRAKVLQRQN